MLNQATMDMLTAMKMSAMAAEFANQLKDPAFNELGFEERLGLLVNAEWNRRQCNKLDRFIRNAHFAVSSATVEGIEYHEDRKLDKAQILRFATCKYIDEGHHIILKGASGNGKTYIACALGNAACRRFKKVQYIRMPELLDELSIARSGGTLKKVLESYKKKDLLILDEWLIRPLSPQESYDMLEIVEARCQKSMIFCTQYQSEGWYTRIDPNPESDSPVSEAIMDRIIHNAYEVLVDGRVSMRERKGLKAARKAVARMCDCLRLCDETCCELELERICYDEMERESMAYFYESQREIQRYLKRIRQLENALTANGISIPEDD